MRLLIMALLLLAGRASAAEDPYLWLEDVGGARAMDWVHSHDAATLATLQADPRYKGFDEQALAIAEARDRVPAPVLLAGGVTNFWQDREHPRGLWRRTTLDDYRKAEPAWTTLLDVDALAAAEHANLVFKGANCREPDETVCLLSFSDGGEDAVTQREFDTNKKAFVPGGFVIARSKQSADWLDDDTLVVATDWGAGSMTTSGYPFVAKRLKRGQQPGEAVELLRGKPGDVELDVDALQDAQGNRVMLLLRGIDAFHTEFYQVSATGVGLLPLPQKAEILGLLDNRLIVKIEEDVALPNGGKLIAGSLASLDMAHREAPLSVIFAPRLRQSLEEAAVGKSRVVAAIYDNVRGRGFVFTPSASGWSSARLALPDNQAVSIVSTTIHSDQAILGVTGFLTPESLWLADMADTATPVQIKTSPARFDAAKDTVEQFQAASTDGTMIPYFVVHPTTMKADSQNPTLLYAYGGFQISELPKYNPTMGKLWLEHGGVYVLANIRGGGEFGPAWHEAALKTHRQTAYDDFAAVARDLIARHITSPPHLGIEGGSNGGLLMGVEFEQHPDLWHAVVIQVPLLDMLRFENIAAGASWTGEYGSVANPAEGRFLAAISPYNNLKPDTAYPKPFIFTTTKDDRVGPVHARKFAARMESMKLPFFYYEATEGGHGAGVNAHEVAQERALEMTYLSRALME